MAIKNAPFRLHVLALIVLSSLGCISSVNNDNNIKIRNIYDELRKDIPFRAGMTISEVKKLYNENNIMVHSLMDEDFNMQKDSFVPIYARIPHCYVYADEFDSIWKPGDKSLSFFVNGMNQFFVDMAIEDHRVINIFVTPGNHSSASINSLRFDGKGEHVGLFADNENYTLDD